MATYPSLQRDVRCDVAIIGAGITGALIAKPRTVACSSAAKTIASTSPRRDRRVDAKARKLVKSVEKAMAYGGNGITYSTLGGALLRAHAERRAHPLKKLFGFERMKV